MSFKINKMLTTHFCLFILLIMFQNCSPAFENSVQEARENSSTSEEDKGSENTENNQPVTPPVTQPVTPPKTSVDLELTTPPTVSIAGNEAKITIELTKNSQLYLEYGINGNLNLETAGEESFKYGAKGNPHIQRLKNLQPGTTYTYIINAKDEAGEVLISEVFTFKTPNIIIPLEPPVNPPDADVPGDWATAAASRFYDESAPMAGIFVGGAPSGGVYGAANTAFAIHQSVRFRAPRTGTLGSVVLQNRTSNVASVFARAPTQPKYQACLDYWAARGEPFVNNESLSERRKAQACAYTIGGTYSAGNGGSLIFEIRPDNGNGEPDMTGTPLGNTTTPFIPIENPPRLLTEHTLTNPASVVAGAWYHMVIRNLTPVQGRYIGISVSEAYNKPLNTGAFSLNGIQFSVGVDVPDQEGPWFEGHRVLFSYEQNTTTPTQWNVDTNTMGWWGARYTTNELIGQFAAMHDGLSANSISGRSGSMHIQGNRHARQLFTAASTTIVDGVWVHHSHAASANGRPMLVEVKQGGTVLATASIPHNSAARNMVANAGSNDLFERTGSAWVYQPLNRAVDITKGVEYSIEFSAPSGAAFRLFSVSQDWNGTNGKYSEYLYGVGQRSENAGRAWQIFPGTGTSFRNNRVLQTLLTVQGMPRSLAE